MRTGDSRGFTLIETLVAASLLTVGLVALAQLGTESLGAGLVAGATTRASQLAGAGLEALRATALTPSPPSTLDRNTPGYVQHLDAAGRVVGVGADPPGAAVVTRRWSVAPWPEAPERLLVVRVTVGPSGDGDAMPAGGRGVARVVALVRRSAP